MLRSLLLVCVTLLPLAAAAQRDPSAENNCYSRLSHDSMRACIKEQSAAATKELESAEKMLASTIQHELRNSKTSARQHLTQANAKYRQYRKAQCSFQAQAATGKKSAPAREMLCTTALDLQRAKDLHATIETLR